MALILTTIGFLHGVSYALEYNPRIDGPNKEQHKKKRFLSGFSIILRPL